MADQLQLRRGTTSQILTFTGAQGEVIVNTDNHALVVQDGATAGGFPTATSSQVTDGTFYYNENVGSAANAYLLDAKTNTNIPTSYLDGVQFGFVSAHPNTGPSTANFSSLGVKNLKYAGGIDPQAGDISGRVYLIYDAANGWMEIQRKVSGVPPQVRTVGASVALNAMTVNIQPDTIDFRSPTLGSGTVNRRTLSAALNLIVPAGATLGTQNGVQSQIAILALDNAGTVLIGVANMAGFTNLDETSLVNTVAITAGASLANVVYSSATVSGLPFRVMGYVQSTQTVAGTWAASPSLIQGQGGQAIIGAAKMILAPAQATTSGTSIDFTGIPSSAKRVTFLFNQVSGSASSFIIVQVGAGSIQTTNYFGSTTTFVNTTISAGTNTQGFSTGSAGAGNSFSGRLSVTNMGNGVWVSDGVMGMTFPTLTTSIVGGSVVVSGILDRVRLTHVNGTDTFDAGSVSLLVEG